MNLEELKAAFEREEVPEDLYSLSGGLPNERFCITQAGGHWEVYYSERGIKSGCKRFGMEKDACLYLYHCVKACGAREDCL